MVLFVHSKRRKPHVECPAVVAPFRTDRGAARSTDSTISVFQPGLPCCGVCLRDTRSCAGVRLRTVQRGFHRGYCPSSTAFHDGANLLFCALFRPFANHSFVCKITEALTKYLCETNVSREALVSTYSI